MQKYYFTFGLGQPNAHFVQPIIAPTWEAAREKMFEKYGPHWAFQYTEEEYNNYRQSDRYDLLYDNELEPLIVEEPAEEEPGCYFCNTFDFGSASANQAEYGARICLAGGSFRYPEDEQFNYCPVCGKKIRKERKE